MPRHSQSRRASGSRSTPRNRGRGNSLRDARGDREVSSPRSSSRDSIESDDVPLSSLSTRVGRPTPAMDTSEHSRRLTGSRDDAPSAISGPSSWSRTHLDPPRRPIASLPTRPSEHAPPAPSSSSSASVLSPVLSPVAAQRSEPEVPLQPPVFQVNRWGTAPEVCPPFEGRVAAQGGFATMVITSPNMDYVPDYPVEREVIETFEDGRWGLREYSRWPQMLVPDMMHVACIPREPSPLSGTVLWERLSPESAWEPDRLTGVSGLGFIKSDIRDRLRLEANAVVRTFKLDADQGDRSMNLPKDYADHGHVLVMILQQCVERMDKLASPPGIAVAVAAHIQRVSLELAGLITYLHTVVSRLSSRLSYERDILPVLGAFVRDATAAQTLHRIGLPTWFLQPLTRQTNIWRIVQVRSLPVDMSGQRSQPAIYHQAAGTAGLANLTGNWLRSMAMSVSKMVSGTHMPPLESVDSPAVYEFERSSLEMKRQRDNHGHIQAKHLGMRAAKAAPPPPKKRPRRANGPDSVVGAASTSSTSPAHQGSNPVASPPSAVQPAKSFQPSPFYSLHPDWRHALRDVSPVPRSEVGALYFFPPPFLLDTVSSQAPIPENAVDAAAARKDDKILRYLHNHLRIRRFCRARLFDPMMSSQPLTIAEWRAALWGDYNGKEVPASAGESSDARRNKRRRDEWNAICRLFGRVALLPSYREDLSVSFRQQKFTARELATADIRPWVLWESHEINFRSELMALDTLLVHRPQWQEIHRWEREREVAEVWGGRSLLSILPADHVAPPADRAPAEDPGHSTGTRIFIQRFVGIMTRWPECPVGLISDVEKIEAMADYDEVRRAALSFYVKTFVRVYQRLPVVPMPFPVM
ncbi:hypothetical protein C2E23DRAFT_901143 [Lenzites betulinus]|nr:hypothetical protein C2E23DRAFT_901143 [Lenzites betulinus]